MQQNLSIGQLVDAVNAWCDQEGIAPASNQAGERITERNVRFYRTIGLVDAPETGGGRGYAEKHLLQLLAVRLLQSQGLPLRRIRDLLLGRSLEDLRRVREMGLAEARAANPPAPRLTPGEDWRMTPLDGEFLLLSRRDQPIPSELLAQIRHLLQSWSTTQKETP